MTKKFHVIKNDGADIQFATTCLVVGAVTFSEYKNWMFYVVEHSEDDVPSFFWDVIDVKEKYDFTLKIADYMGFCPSWDPPRSEFNALIGICFRRFPDHYEDTVSKSEALAALESHPSVERRFREIFPFIEW
ncbi:hypothetical protein [Pannonibacter phragmitetus]|uniref:hypothetical protein n=1 Tax=Pannonibacter phragmitetus TaxID=121719 RepID=UPI000AE73891|nr:hypothetical protein [Pannonibacter phragmitetus]